MLFLAGVPGALKRLKDRLVPSGTTETLTDARMLKLDNLDATVASRAPSATALSTATWTGTIAGRIDASISSVAEKAPASLVGYGAYGSEQSGHGTTTTLGALSANTYAAAVIDITAASGWLRMALAYRGSTLTNHAQLTMRVTIDGTAFEITDGVTTDTATTAMYAVGYATASALTLDRVRFRSSLKIEVKASTVQASGKVKAKYIYTVDAS